MSFKWLVLGKGGVDDVGREPADSSGSAVSVTMTHWNVEHRVFAVEQFVRNSDSVVTVQRLFRRKFDVERRGAIPDRNTILRWVEAFRTTGSVTKSVHEQTTQIEELKLSIRQEIAAVPQKKCWSVRCRTLRRGSECVSGKKDVICLTLFSVRNLVYVL
jgi:hypothetical protein